MAKDCEAVEGQSYCMNSWQKRNVQQTNQQMGLHNMNDRANAGKPPQSMHGAKSNPQLGPKMPK